MAIRPAAEATFEFSVPVVVVGAGACGLVAALTVAEAGTAVLVLERDARPSGSTSLSAGLVPAANTRLQRERGVADDPDLFAADLAAKAHGENDPAVVRAVAEASGATIDWLVEAQGLDLHLVEGFTYPGHSRLRMHGPRSQTGADLETMLLAAAGRAEIDVMTQASVEDLFAGEDGRVVAVGIRRPDGTREVVGCEAVVLACNGFGGNADLVRRHIPEMAGAEYCGPPSNTGDALALGTALGAAAADLGSYQGHGSVPVPHAAPLTWAVITLGGIQVNTEGRRFANEMRGYSEHAEEVLRQPGRMPRSAPPTLRTRAELGIFQSAPSSIIHPASTGVGAGLLLDQAGWHTTKTRLVPGNITLLPLPARSPELNPVENLWQFMRENWLGNRSFQSYPDILDQCCEAWNKLIAQPWRIMSIGMRRSAHEC